MAGRSAGRSSSAPGLTKNRAISTVITMVASLSWPCYRPSPRRTFATCMGNSGESISVLQRAKAAVGVSPKIVRRVCVGVLDQPPKRPKQIAHRLVDDVAAKLGRRRRALQISGLQGFFVLRRELPRRRNRRYPRADRSCRNIPNRRSTFSPVSKRLFPRADRSDRARAAARARSMRASRPQRWECIQGLMLSKRIKL